MGLACEVHRGSNRLEDSLQKRSPVTSHSSLGKGRGSRCCEGTEKSCSEEAFGSLQEVEPDSERGS